MESITKKTSRAPNWTIDEILALINGYRLRIKTIDGKFSSTLTAKHKRDAYEELTSEVNSVSSIGGRTWEQVKKKLEDQKSRTREKAAKIKKYRTATGGGPACDLVLKAHEEVLLGLINPQMVSGIIEDGDSAIELALPSRPTDENADEEATSGESSKNGKGEEIALTPINDFKKLDCKRKRSLWQSETQPSRVTSSQANEMLEIERQKLDLGRKLVEIKRLQLQLLIKQMKNSGIDVTAEQEKLSFI